MNIKYNILPLLAAVTLLTACGDDDIDRVYTVGEAENTLILRAGVSEDGAGVVTRAGDENHTKHVAFTSGTQIALRVDGTWTGHSPSSDIKQKTVATLGGASDKHNALSTYNPVLFWDDYGTADPANKETGRAQGLTIYGAAVDGKTSLPTTLSGLDNTQSTWTSLPWQVCSESTPSEIDQTSGWSEYDLVTSNNVVYSSTPANDNAYKFADRSAGKLLEFTHAMTKITVQLTAGEGFPRTDEANAETAQFEAAPSVTLEGFYYKGTVDVEAKTSTPTTTATANVKMHGGAAAHIATFDALVFPGNTFANTDQILTLTADGNTYKVTAEKLNAAIVAAIASTDISYPAVSGDYALKQAWNYKLQITVNKTDIKITATIKDWDPVEAAEEAPEIRIDETYGHDGTAFEHDFDFFRSETKAGGYSKDAYVAYNGGSYTFHDQLYWPNHEIHYFFRGVYPRVQTASEAGWIPAGNVSSSTTSASTIDVSNAAYAKGTYPSDLALGWPKTSGDARDDETCKVSDHNSKQGICATEGIIKMNFSYVMSQVEVELQSVTGDAAVSIGENTVVKLVNVYNNGKIKLSDGSVTGLDASRGSYTLDNVTDEPTKRLSAIVPQKFSYEVGATGNTRFEITVTNADGTKDVYCADVKPIKKSGSTTELVAPDGWESGVHYKYVLTLSKTALNVTATLTDWVTVEASDEVWF